MKTQHLVIELFEEPVVPPVLPIVLVQPLCSSCEWESAPVWKRRKVMVTRGERLSACSGLLSQGFLLIDSKKHPK